MIWKHLTQHDAKELIAWTNAQLDHEPRIVGDYFFWPWLDRSERELIMHGDDLSPPDKRGRPRDDKVWEAACDVKTIRRLWKQHKEFLDSRFKGRTRTSRVEVTAEQIAADRSGVDSEAVRIRLHKKL
jgi:hypothetical protein